MLRISATDQIGFRVARRRALRPSLLDTDKVPFGKILQTHQSYSVLFLEPSIGRVTDYGQQPRTGIRTGLLLDSSEGSNARLLQYVIGVRSIARQPSGERVRVREMRLD